MRKSLLVIQIYWGVGRWGTVGGSGWVGRKSFKSKTKKRNWVGGWEKIKFQKKKTEIRGWERANKKKSTWDGTGIEKRILSSAPSIHLVHWWVLVHSGHNEPAPTRAP